MTGRIQIMARMAGPWRVTPQKRHSKVCVNSIVLGKCVVQKQRHNLVASQAFLLESPGEVLEEVQADTVSLLSLSI